MNTLNQTQKYSHRDVFGVDATSQAEAQQQVYEKLENIEERLAEKGIVLCGNYSDPRLFIEIIEKLEFVGVNNTYICIYGFSYTLAEGAELTAAEVKSIAAELLGVEPGAEA